MRLLPDALAPYASLLKWLLIALLLAATFVSGCQRGEANAAADVAKADQATSDARRERDDANNALRLVNEQAEFERAMAAAQAERAAAALRTAQRERDRYLEQLGTIDDDIRRAMRDPGCRAALEARTCAALL